VNEHDAIARIKRLSHSINCADEIAEVIERLIKERDEARRMCCEQAAMDESGYVKHGDMLHFAESRGWDCFNKNPTGNALTTTK